MDARQTASVRASAAARSRRCRQRARDGVMVVPIAIPADFVLDLIDSGLLAPAAGEDRAAIARAIERFIEASRVTPFTCTSGPKIEWLMVPQVDKHGATSGCCRATRSQRDARGARIIDISKRAGDAWPVLRSPGPLAEDAG